MPAMTRAQRATYQKVLAALQQAQEDLQALGLAVHDCLYHVSEEIGELITDLATFYDQYQQAATPKGERI
jgi:hypothetical protein